MTVGIHNVFEQESVMIKAGILTECCYVGQTTELQRPIGILSYFSLEMSEGIKWEGTDRHRKRFCRGKTFVLIMNTSFR